MCLSQRGVVDHCIFINPEHVFVHDRSSTCTIGLNDDFWRSYDEAAADNFEELEIKEQ